MKSRKALFICGTPFHVITSVILKFQLNVSADIIIYDSFPNTSKLKENLLKENVFNSVRVIDKEKEYGMPQLLIFRYFFALFSYFKLKKIIKNVIPNIDEYSDVFFANDQAFDVIDRIVFCYLKKYNSTINIHYIVDGLGSYHEEYYELTRLDYWARKLIVKHNSYIIDCDIFLYSAKLYNQLNPNGKRNIIEVNKINEDNKNLLIRIFSYACQNIDKYNEIIFDTVREEEFVGKGSYCFNKVVNGIVDKNHSIVKAHPREKKEFFDLPYFDVSGIPFEIMCLYNDFSKYRFINNYSNAVFTPKLIFDQEPEVVFTYKLLNNYMKDKSDKDRMVLMLRRLYRDKSKVIILGEDK